MHRYSIFRFIIACLSLVICHPLLADSLDESIQNGKVSLNIRYRIETVDQGNPLQDATASTVRTRLGYTTDEFNGFSAHLDFEDVHAVIKDDYFAVVSGDPAYSTVADPEDSELNQAYLDYRLESTKFRVGRQRLILDNARFVGNVGWRQNEQTYDGFSLVNTSFDNTTITFAHINNVNRVFFNNLNMSNDLFNVSYKGFADSTLTFYGYFLEYDEAINASHKTLGIRYNTKINQFLLTAEFAAQSEYKDGAGRDTDYSLLEGGYAFNEQTSVKLGLETLGSENGVSFQTPLATLHAFNGWADLFLTTPDNGLEDTYVSFSTKLNKVKLAAVYHNFAANTGGADYGKELDLLASMKLKKNLSGGIKLARYDADTYAVDTNKFWLWLEYKM